MFLMTFLQAFFVLAVSAQTLSTATLNGTLVDNWCGELDPFFGDTCLVFVTTPDQQRYGLVLDFDAWPYHDADLVGRSISAVGCETLADSDTLASLTNFDNSSIYLSCFVDDLTIDSTDLEAPLF